MRLLAAALLLLASVPALAQSSSVEGSVTDAQRQALPGVSVTLRGPGAERTSVTDASGSYRFEGLAEGVYRVGFEARGFRRLELRPVAVAAAGTARADASLAVSLVEAVTVTAQRREEDLQDVPVSVTALGSRALERDGISDLSRLGVAAPGLNVALAGEDARPALRGTRTENIGAVNDPVVGFYVDGVYRSRFAQALHSFVDVERVELQRGPQGTLFGRNSFGGTVSVVTNAPAPGLDFGGSAFLGSYARRKLEGFVNAPLGRAFRFRVAGMSERRDGYVQNAGAAPDIWDEDLDYLRASLRLAPSDRLELLARFNHWDQGGNGQGDFGLVALGTLRDPASGRISLAGVRDPVSPRRGSLGAPLDSPYALARDVALSRDNHENVGSLAATFRTSTLELKSITSFTRFKSFRQNDGDFSGNRHALESVDERLRSFTQELQLASRRDARLSFVVGAFLLRDELRYRFLFDRLTRDVDTDGNPETASAPGTEPSPGTDVLNLESLDTRSSALFGQATFALTPRLRLTGGARLTRDEKTYSFLNELSGRYNLGFQGAEVRDLENRWTQATWKGGLDYRASSDHMIYGSVATGFVAGGFAVLAPTLSYGPQHVTSYEVGVKSRFGGKTRLDLSAYYSAYADLLANAYGSLTGVFFVYQTNAGSVSAKGVELELETAPVEALRLEAALALQDSSYGEFVLPNPFPRGGDPRLPGNLVRLDGTQVQQQPRARLAVGAGYDIALGRLGTLTPYLRSYLTSAFGVNDIVLGRDRVSIQEGFTKTDLRLAYAPRGKRLRVQAFVLNLENQAVLLRVVRGGDDILQAGYAPPRTWGVQVSYRR